MENPKIRFKGFTKDWEQRKVSELCSISTGKSNTQDKVEDGEYPFYVRSPIIERSTKYLYDEEAVLTVGDGVGTGKVFHYVNGKYDLHQRCYRMYDFTDELNAHYFYHTFSKLFYKRVMAMTAKTSVDSVRLEMIADMEIPAPKIDEQIKIGTYFDNLDHLITLHQRKCDQTKNLKKYMLQKMFPQNGAKVPEIRFNGFTHDWEQRKFGSLLEETRNKTIFEDEDTLLSCAIDGMYLNSELFSHFRGSSNIGYLKVKKNDLILSAQNLHLGNCNVNLRFEHGIISPAYKVYELVGCNPLFMQAWVKKDSTKDFFLKSSTEGASVCRKNIVWEELYKQELPVPSIEEQTKVGEYFYSLDHLITLHQRQCDELKKMKKYMLQNMFI